MLRGFGVAFEERVKSGVAASESRDVPFSRQPGQPPGDEKARRYLNGDAHHQTGIRDVRQIRTMRWRDGTQCARSCRTVG
jgi:hypothetical protein